MKKKLLAAAVLTALASVAQAATSVTLYGLIDTGIGYNRITGDANGADYSGSRIGMINGVQAGSRWGLRGTEDLGDGLRAVFRLENGFNSADGSRLQQGRMFGRQATIGLADDAWGSVDFGRQTSVGSLLLADINPFRTTFTQASIGTTFSAANTMRWDNMVLYRSPWTDGFQFAVGYSFNVDGTDKEQSGFRTSDNARGITAGLRYANGPLNIVLTFDQLNGSNLASVDAFGDPVDHNATPRQYAVGMSYDLEVVKLAAAYGRTTDGWFVGQDLPAGVRGKQAAGAMRRSEKLFGTNRYEEGFRANSYMLGATVPLGGGGSVFGAWQHASASSDALTGDDANMDIWSLGYTYDLSKRTNLYVYGSYGKNYAFIEGLKSTAGGVGIQHRF
ncbi:porin [Achromobacter xylosoxidans]